MATDLALSRRLRALEESPLRPDVRKSIRLAELTADDFVDCGSAGRIYTKGELVAALHAEAPVAVTASDFNVSLLATEVALVRYRTLATRILRRMRCAARSGGSPAASGR